MLCVWLVGASPAAPPAAPAIPPEAARLTGVWRNPPASIHLELRECGIRLCGRVLWASDKARADARRGGTDPLVGAELLRDLERTGPDRWRGTIFVPDLGRNITGTITLLDQDRFRARSCVLGIACRSQVWTRLARP